VVAALVTPDTFSLTRDGVPVSSQIGSKHTRVDAAPGGGTCTSVVPTAHRVRPSISAAQLRALAGLGVRVEEHYGRPQDIEWAFSQGNLFLLQARPITVAASPTPGHAPVRGRIERVLLDDLVEHFPAPFPLDLCAVHAVQGAVQDLMTAAGARAVPATSLVRGDDDGVIRAEVARPRLSPALLIRVPRLLRGGMSQGPVQWRAAAAAQRTRLEELTRRADRVASAEDAAVLGCFGTRWPRRRRSPPTGSCATTRR
jgi:pyruvate,water dikinase